MVECLLQFPPEIREHVFYYCSKSDLVNVACCCKAYHNSVKYLLWEKVQFSWLKVKNDLPTNILDNLKWTTCLSFYIHDNNGEDEDNGDVFIHFHNDNIDDSDDSSDNNVNNDDHQNTVDNTMDKCLQKYKTITWIEVALNYQKILSHCDPNRVISLHIVGIIGGHGISQTVQILHNIQQLSMSNISLSYLNSWRDLTKLKQLKKLSLLNCEIEDSSVGEIITATKVDDIALNQCSGIREISLMHISKAFRITNVTISHNSYISSKSYRCLGNLTNLVKLNLEYTNIDDDAFSHLCMRCKKLKTLNVYGSINLTDIGFHSISKLPLLKELNINMCTNITSCGFSYLEKIELRKLSFSWSNNICDSVFLQLSNIYSLKELNIININNRLSIAAIDNYCKKVNMKKKDVYNSWIFSFFTLQKDYLVESK